MGVPPSGFFVTGLYLKYPKRKSVSQLELKVLLKPVAKLVLWVIELPDSPSKPLPGPWIWPKVL